MDQQDVTLGEVYRRLCVMDERARESDERIARRLDSLDARFRELNGSVSRHTLQIEAHTQRFAGLDREVRDVKRALASVPDEALAQITTLVQGFQTTAATAADRRDDVISIPVNAKTLTALVIAAITVAAALAAALLKVGP